MFPRSTWKSFILPSRDRFHVAFCLPRFRHDLIIQVTQGEDQLELLFLLPGSFGENLFLEALLLQFQQYLLSSWYPEKALSGFSPGTTAQSAEKLKRRK